MELQRSCKEAIASCLNQKTFAVAHLYNDEKTMDVHIHESYEIYFSISGGKQFLIDNRFYSIEPGDIFFINQYESHHLTYIDEKVHERIVLSIYPDFLKKLSSGQTNLDNCFSSRDASNPNLHKRSLNAEEQKLFLYFIHKLVSTKGFGADLVDGADGIFIKINFLYYLSDQKKKFPLHKQIFFDTYPTYFSDRYLKKSAL